MEGLTDLPHFLRDVSDAGGEREVVCETLDAP